MPSFLRFVFQPLDAMHNDSEILIYQTPNGNTKVDVRLEGETVWLNQYQLADLFQTDRTSIAKHIKNIYETGELIESSTCAKIAQVQKEGNRTINRNILYYNLDIIISVGYRVHSFLTLNDREILAHTGKISHEDAEKYALQQFEKYKKQLKAGEVDELDKAIKKIDPSK